MVPLPTLVQDLRLEIVEGRAPARPCLTMGLHPGTRPSRRPALQVQNSCDLASGYKGRWRNEGKPEALGLRRASPLSPGAERRSRSCIRKNADRPPGLRNSHEFLYTSGPEGLPFLFPFPDWRLMIIPRDQEF